MSESRVPDVPLPRPFLRVISEAPVTRDEMEHMRKNLQGTIDSLETELERERDLTKKLGKSSAVLQEILSAPDFRAVSARALPRAAATGVAPQSGTHIDEPPIEYVEVKEIELTDAEVSQQESKVPQKKPT